MRRDATRFPATSPGYPLSEPCWWLAPLSSLAWLVLSRLVLRPGSAVVAIVLLAAVVLLSASDGFLSRVRRGFPPRRKLAGHALTAALALLLTLLIARLRGQLGLTVDAFALLLAVVTVAWAGGPIPAVIEAVAGSLLLRSVTPQPGKHAIAGISDAVLLSVLAAVAVLVGVWAEGGARRTRQAALAARESDGQFTRLAANLLDMSRLQGAGPLPVFPRPTDLGTIIASLLGGFSLQARAIRVEVPDDLPEVMADPAITRRVVVNLIDNALRYAPAGSPLRLTATARGDRVELCVIDRGPGIPEADRDRAFLPYRRLGACRAGVGLGLTVSRGLAEAMGATLQPAATSGGGLTMTLSLPAARDRAADRWLLAGLSSVRLPSSRHMRHAACQQRCVVQRRVRQNRCDHAA